MLHSFQMKEAVDKEEFEEIFGRVLKKRRLATHIFHAKDDFAACGGEREAQDVGRGAFGTIRRVEAAHL